MGVPQTLPANFDGWDKSAPPATLPKDFSGWDGEKSAKSASAVPSFWDTLTREGKALTGTIAGMPAAVYHAFSEPPTKEEAEKFGGEDQVSGAKRVGLGLHRLTTAPVEVAAKFYSDAAKGKYGDASAVESAMLNEAPEAVGQGAGASVAGKLVEVAPGVAKAGIEKAPAVVRALARGVNKGLEKAPGTIGGTVGAGVGAYFGGHVGAEVGGVAGTVAGKELLPQVRIPGEGFGLPDRVVGGPAVVPQSSSPAAATPGTIPARYTPPAAAPEAEAAAIPEPMAKTAAGETIPRTVPPKPTTVTDLARQINEALGGKPLKPGVPLRSQAAAVAKLPEGFTPVDSSALKGYKYDAAAREFESITQNGQHYIHGDVSPEDAQAFADADSKGKAWQQIRQNPLVAKVVNGKRVSIHPARSMMADPGGTEETPESKTPAKPAAINDDLTAILEESLKRARQARASQ